MDKSKKISIVCLVVLIALNIIFLCQPISTLGRYRRVHEFNTPENYNRTLDSSIYFDKNTVYIKEKIDYTSTIWEDYTNFYLGLYKVIRDNETNQKGKYLFIIHHRLGSEQEASCSIYQNLSIFSITKVSDNSENKVKYVNETSIVIQVFLIILIAFNAIYLYKLIKKEKTA